MIDLEKLRERAEQLPKGFSSVSMWVNAGEAIELLDHIAALEKDTGRLDWLESSKESHGFCHMGNGEYLYYAHQMSGYKSVRETIDTAMESKHG